MRIDFCCPHCGEDLSIVCEEAFSAPCEIVSQEVCTECDRQIQLYITIDTCNDKVNAEVIDEIRI